MYRFNILIIKSNDHALMYTHKLDLILVFDLYYDNIGHQSCSCLFQMIFKTKISFYPHLRTCLLILKRGREILIWERNIGWLPFVGSLTGDWTCNPGMCPDQEWNLRPFGRRDNAPAKWVTPLARDQMVFYVIESLYKQLKTHLC